MFGRELHIGVQARSPKQQKDISNTIERLQKDFPDMKIRIESESGQLVPEEVLLKVVISVASGVSSALVLKLLDRLWSKLRSKDISPILSGTDLIQKKAEKYLLDIGITDFDITKREDRGLYISFVFKSKKALHYLCVLKSDLGILNYRKRRS